MKNYNLIITVLFKSGVEKRYKAPSIGEVEEQDMKDGIEVSKDMIKKVYREGIKSYYEIDDNTVVNIQDTSAIKFSYEEVENYK